MTDSNRSEQPDVAGIREEFQRFIEGFNSLILATVSPDGVPESSYAPALQQDGDFYIYVSQLATHTGNLLHAIQNQTAVSLMMIQPESEARNLFARQRVVISAMPESVERGSEHWISIMDAMETRLGNTVGLIRQLADFQLIRLTPASANYVAGFGKAYKLSGDGLVDVEHQRR